MTMDEFDELKQAFASENAAPRAGAKEAAIGAALAAYDSRVAAGRQGSGAPGRLRSAAHAAFEILT